MLSIHVARTLAAVCAASVVGACTSGGLDIGAELEAVPQFTHSAAAGSAVATSGSFSTTPSSYAAVASPAVPTPDARTQSSPAEVETEQASVPETPSEPVPAVMSEEAGEEPKVEVAALTPSAHAGVSSTRGAIAPVVLTHDRPREIAARSAELDALIARYAAHYQLPLQLVRRVVRKESNFNPAARNRIYWGLMQIRHDTARTMGYRGPAEGLLDAETNLNYAVRYLRGAYITAGGNQDQAVRHYQRGYYFHARDRGLLEETGLGRDRRRRG